MTYSVKPRNDLSDKGRAVEEWLDLRFFRPIGIRIARALYSTGISPDQVTLWSLLVGLVAGQLLVYQDRWIDVIGFVLFIVSDVFDSADGQLARLRGTSTRFGRALDGINDNLRFVNLYFHLMYRLMHGGVWWAGVLLVALAGLAHTYQSAAVDFIRNAFLDLGTGKAGELDLPEDLGAGSAGTVLERFGARVYRDYVVRQSQLFPARSSCCGCCGPAGAAVASPRPADGGRRACAHRHRRRRGQRRRRAAGRRHPAALAPRAARPGRATRLHRHLYADGLASRPHPLGPRARLPRRL